MAKDRVGVFPWDFLNPSHPYDAFPGKLGALVRRVDPIAMFPPYPWGQWLYAKVILDRCATLPGDIIETGVGLGGMSIFLALLAESQGWKKKVYSVDSFQGLPAPDPRKDNPYFVQGEYGPVPKRKESIQETFAGITRDFGVADRVVPVQGFFADVLPALVKGKKFSVVHIDADLFDSVYCALDNLYDRVVDGGVIIIDDFFHHVQGPLRAASEFFNARKKTPVYHVSFPYSIFIFKGEDAGARMRSLDGNVYSFEWLRRDRVLRSALLDSLRRSWDHPRARENCGRLLDLLKSKVHRSSDVFEYWRALEDFWDGIGTPTPDRPPEMITKL